METRHATITVWLTSGQTVQIQNSFTSAALSQTRSFLSEAFEFGVMSLASDNGQNLMIDKRYIAASLIELTETV